MSCFLSSHALPSFHLSFPLRLPGRPVSAPFSGTFPQNPQVAHWLVPTVSQSPHLSHPQFTKPNPDALNPSFIAHSSLVLHKSQRLRNFLRLKRHCKVWPRHVYWCLIHTGPGLENHLASVHWSLLSGPHPSARLEPQDRKQPPHSQSGSGKGSVSHLDLAAILTSWAFGPCTLRLLTGEWKWEKGIRQPLEMSEMIRVGWADIPGLENQLQICPVFWHSWASQPHPDCGFWLSLLPSQKTIFPCGLPSSGLSRVEDGCWPKVSLHGVFHSQTRASQHGLLNLCHHHLSYKDPLHYHPLAHLKLHLGA